jgi:tRNA nucleotidyltransferase (CCA-adding enzyme)
VDGYARFCFDSVIVWVKTLECITMKYKKINIKTEHALNSIVHEYPMLTPIAHAIGTSGGRALLVGGAVRDMLAGTPVHDIDIEVHGLSLHQLETLLRRWGIVNLVGESFGVLKLEHIPIDWSVPRTDSAGRKPVVQFDPTMPLEKAFERRDVTINAMGIDLNTHELIDPFNGEKDLEAHILRAPNIDLFVQDPLRFFRIMHFIGRFEMQPDSALTACCKRMSLEGISKERIAAEFEKLLLLSKRPSLGIRWLHSIQRLEEILPELYNTVGIEQQPEWHPEGDVFEHSMQALDAAARISYESTDDRLTLRYAALCHDLGKAVTTRLIDGRLRSFGHETAGVPLAECMLKRIVLKKDIIDDVGKLVAVHMLPGAFIAHNAGAAAYKRLALKIAPRRNVSFLADLALADQQGRNGSSSEPFTLIPEFIPLFKKQAAQVHVLYQPEPPLLMGRDLLEYASGVALGRLCKRAYEIQINEGITDKEELKRRVLKE